MGLKLVTAPAEIVTLVEAKRQLNIVDANDDDDYITSLVAAATAWLDGKDGFLGRSLGQQTWDYALDDFPVGNIKVPLSPLVSVTSVTYSDPDTNGDTVLAEDTDYAVDTFSDPGRILSLSGSWPQTKLLPNAVRIRFVSGYATVPAPLRHAILLMVGHWYENREAVSVVKLNEVPATVDALITPYRNWLHY